MIRGGANLLLSHKHAHAHTHTPTQHPQAAGGRLKGQQLEKPTHTAYVVTGGAKGYRFSFGRFGVELAAQGIVGRAQGRGHWRKRFGHFIRKRRRSHARSEAFSGPSFLASFQVKWGNDFHTFWRLTPHCGGQKRTKKKVRKSGFFEKNNLKDFCSLKKT